jgi:hypothetical protein
MSQTNGTTAAETDCRIDQLYSWMPPMTAAPLCPEALFSLTIRGKLDGQETLLTVRGQTVDEFQRNLQAVRGLLDAVQAPPPAQPASVTPQCPVHTMPMQRHENAKGGGVQPLL